MSFCTVYIDWCIFSYLLHLFACMYVCDSRYAVRAAALPSGTQQTRRPSPKSQQRRRSPISRVLLCLILFDVDIQRLRALVMNSPEGSTFVCNGVLAGSSYFLAVVVFLLPCRWEKPVHRALPRLARVPWGAQRRGLHRLP